MSLFLCGASDSFKTFSGIIKKCEHENLIRFFSLSGIGTGRVKLLHAS